MILLSILVIGSSFMSVSWLVLELWQFPFMKNLQEIGKSEITPSEFFPIPGDWDESGIPKLARRFLIKCYWILQNPMVNAFTVSDILRENQHGKNYQFFLCNFYHSHKKRKDSLETRAVFSWILVLTWNFGGGRSDSASTFFKNSKRKLFLMLLELKMTVLYFR